MSVDVQTGPACTEAVATAPAPPLTTHIPGLTPSTGRPRWIHDWDPEDTEFWDRTGAKVARRNLIFSILAEYIGFLHLDDVVDPRPVPRPKYGLTPAQKFTLVSVAAGCGALLRLPYTFAVAMFGGRNWTVVSAGLLLVPCLLTAVLLEPGIGYSTLLILAAVGGVGGGNFASSMTNINTFYPNRLKGWALGLNAAGGNLDVATMQLVGLFVLATAGVNHPKLVLVIYIPLIVIGMTGAALYMDNLAHVSNDKRAMRDVARDRHTWIMSFLYIGTFRSFIGFGFAFGMVLDSAYLTFVLFYAACGALTWYVYMRPSQRRLAGV